MKVKNLQSGTMGTVIFLYQYSRLTEDASYETLADNLLEEIINKISSDMSQNFKDGIWGIGWGIEYLVRNNYIEGDVDAILAEMDHIAVAQINKYTLEEIGLNRGIIGLGRYILARIAFEEDPKENEQHLTLKEYLIYLLDWLESKLGESEGHIGEIVDFSVDLLKMGFYPSKVKKIMEHCLKTNEGMNYISDIKLY